MSEQAVEPFLVELEDGTYTIEILLEGGSGRASITSPAELNVENHTANVAIEWSSANYDYMVLEGKTYNPVNEDGNSVFELPVVAFDEPVEVIADTTAMSIPHEITYTILLNSKSIQNSNNTFSSKGDTLVIVCVVVAILVAVTFAAKKKKVKMKNKYEHI